MRSDGRGTLFGFVQPRRRVQPVQPRRRVQPVQPVQPSRRDYMGSLHQYTCIDEMVETDALAVTGRQLRSSRRACSTSVQVL